MFGNSNLWLIPLVGNRLRLIALHQSLCRRIYYPTRDESQLFYDFSFLLLGIKNLSPLTFEKGKEPLYLVVRHYGAMNEREDFLDFPREIKISHQKYQLGMINLFDAGRQHFTSIHSVEGFT